jgi:tripartite ATP-independent transporter DctM subunit
LAFDNITIGIIGVIVMLVLMFLRVPVAFSLITVGFVGYYLVVGYKPAMNVITNTFYSNFSNYNLSAVPLFILMGYFAHYTGIVNDLFDTCRKWIGHTKGGLIQATILGGASFGAISGSSFASTATLSKICIPAMLNHGVDRRLAYGTVASVGPLASMIPPSVLMIVIGIATNMNIGKLLIGGIGPGLLAAICYMVLVYLLVSRNRSLAPPIEKVPLREKLLSLRKIWLFVLVMLIIIAGIYTGTFTPTEAGAVGAFVVFIIFLIKNGLNWKIIGSCVLETLTTTSSVFLLMGGAFLFSNFLTVSKLTGAMSDFMVNLPVPPIVVLLGVIVMYLIIGCFMDLVAAMFITLPIVFPAIIAIGYDQVWFCVLLAFLAEVSGVTPPFGLQLFIIRGAVPGSTMKDIYTGALPFIIADMIIIAILILFPAIITWLPSRL